MKNTVSDPLILTFNQSQFEYKVNKPYEQSGEYVDKQLAVELLEAFEKIKLYAENHEEHSVRYDCEAYESIVSFAKDAIKKAKGE